MHVFNPSLPPSPFITEPSLSPSSHTSPQPLITIHLPIPLSLLFSPLLIETFIKHLPKMAKLGKLTKLKSAIKRWPSLTKLSRNNSCVSAASDSSHKVAAASLSKEEQELHAVYVGKSRRRYLVNSDIIEHPVFQELVDRSSCSSSGGCDDGVVVSCEVVLFEHLLWMLESNETQLGSMDELVEFYTCAC